MARKMLYKKGGKPKKAGKKKQGGGFPTALESLPEMGPRMVGSPSERLMPIKRGRVMEGPPTPPERTAPGYGDMTYAEKLGLKLGLKTGKTSDVMAKRRADAAARRKFFESQGIDDPMAPAIPPKKMFKKGGKKKKKKSPYMGGGVKKVYKTGGEWLEKPTPRID